MKKVLFISHDASRTGAPIVLLNFLEWLKNEGGFEISVFLRKGGPLENDFKAVGTVYRPLTSSRAKQLFNKALSKVVRVGEDHQIPPTLFKQSFQMVYLNTVVSLVYAPVLKAAFNCPVVCHVHENEFSIRYYFQRFMAVKNLENTDHFIAVSQSTSQNLMKHYGIAPSKISLVNAFTDLKKIKEQSVPKETIKKELGLSVEFIVGGSGLTTWRKGIDIFVQLAVVLNELRPGHQIKLLWVGTTNYEFESQFSYEADRLGVTAQLIFTGARPDPQNYFQLFDVFVLTSREDPFPLVVIETAALNKPVICFDNAGGMPELIENEKNGLVIPYGDTREMAKHILRLMDNEELRLSMGVETGKLMANFDVSVGGKQIVKVINQLITS